MQNWDTAGGLYDFISVAMPPDAPGTLGEKTYLDIVAYIMSFNGAKPGSAPLVKGDDLYKISLSEQTAAGAPAVASAAATPEPAVAVPQAYTWGKQLPGGAPPVAAAAKSAVPQAFTWGKQLPQAKTQ